MLNDDVIIRSQQRFRSDQHRVYTEEVNKIALSGNDDKRIQTFDKVTTYSYGTNTFKVCENDVRYVILKNKSQTPGNDSQILRNDLQILRKESQILRNKSQILRNESQALRKESQIPRNKSQILRIKSQILRNKSQILRNKSQALRSDHHRVYTEEVNKIALNSNNDKKIQTFDKFTVFPYEKMYAKYVKMRCC